MRRVLLAVAALLLAACAGPTPTPTPTATVPLPTPTATGTAPVPSPSGSCQQMTAHIYNPTRLGPLDGCALVSVTGTIAAIRKEADGDEHVLLQPDASDLDPHGGHWVSAANQGQELGDLVMEPVCEGPVTQVDAVAACQGYHNPLLVPPVGSHVTAWGYWVEDHAHGDWYELHPLVAISVTVRPTEGVSSGD